MRIATSNGIKSRSSIPTRPRFFSRKKSPPSTQRVQAFRDFLNFQIPDQDHGIREKLTRIYEPRIARGNYHYLGESIANYYFFKHHLNDLQEQFGPLEIISCPEISGHHPFRRLADLYIIQKRKFDSPEGPLFGEMTIVQEIEVGSTGYPSPNQITLRHEQYFKPGGSIEFPIGSGQWWHPQFIESPDGQKPSQHVRSWLVSVTSSTQPTNPIFEHEGFLFKKVTLGMDKKPFKDAANRIRDEIGINISLKEKPSKTKRRKKKPKPSSMPKAIESQTVGISSVPRSNLLEQKPGVLIRPIRKITPAPPPEMLEIPSWYRNYSPQLQLETPWGVTDHILLEGPKDPDTPLLFFQSPWLGWFDFFPLLPLWQGKAHVVAASPPGVGYSTPHSKWHFEKDQYVQWNFTFLEQILDQLGNRALYMVGLDFGCQMALDTAIENQNQGHPFSIRGLFHIHPWLPYLEEKSHPLVEPDPIANSFQFLMGVGLGSARTLALLNGKFFKSWQKFCRFLFREDSPDEGSDRAKNREAFQQTLEETFLSSSGLFLNPNVAKTLFYLHQAKVNRFEERDFYKRKILELENLRQILITERKPQGNLSPIEIPTTLYDWLWRYLD